MSDDRFRAIGMGDITMPGGWSVSDGQTFLYTPAEREIMHQSRAFIQREILPNAAAAHQEVKQIKASHEGRARREKLRAIARAYLEQLGDHLVGRHIAEGEFEVVADAGFDLRLACLHDTRFARLKTQPRDNKIAQFLNTGDKQYEGVVQLGAATDTGDCTGRHVRDSNQRQGPI